MVIKVQTLLKEEVVEVVFNYYLNLLQSKKKKKKKEWSNNIFPESERKKLVQIKLFKCIRKKILIFFLQCIVPRA